GAVMLPTTAKLPTAGHPAVIISPITLLVFPFALSEATIDETPMGVEQLLIKDQESLPPGSADKRGKSSVCPPEEAMKRRTGLFGVYPIPSKLNVVPCVPEQLASLGQVADEIVRFGDTHVVEAYTYSSTKLLVVPDESTAKIVEDPAGVEHVLVNDHKSLPVESADNSGVRSRVPEES